MVVVDELAVTRERKSTIIMWLVEGGLEWLYKKNFGSHSSPLTPSTSHMIIVDFLSLVTANSSTTTTMIDGKPPWISFFYALLFIYFSYNYHLNLLNDNHDDGHNDHTGPHIIKTNTTNTINTTNLKTNMSINPNHIKMAVAATAAAVTAGSRCSMSWAAGMFFFCFVFICFFITLMFILG